MDTLRITGVGGGRDAGADVGLTQVALQRGVGDVVIGGRVGGSGKVERVGGGEGGVGGVASVVEGAGGMERSAIEVFGGGWENSRCAQDAATLGRLRTRVGGVRGGGGDRVGTRVQVGSREEVERNVGGHHLKVHGRHADK